MDMGCPEGWGQQKGSKLLVDMSRKSSALPDKGFTCALPRPSRFCYLFFVCCARSSTSPFVPATRS